MNMPLYTTKYLGDKNRRVWYQIPGLSSKLPAYEDPGFQSELQKGREMGSDLLKVKGFPTTDSLLQANLVKSQLALA